MKKLNFPGVRLGGTSWVVEGSFADNLRELSREARDMQFVLFDNKYGVNIPSKEEVSWLAALKNELGMSCTVHFPHDICLSTEPAERVRCEDSCLRIMELFAPLDPFAWILHLDGEQYGAYPSADMEGWLEKTRRSVARLAAAAADKEKICAETLDYNFRLVYPAVAENGISVCLDVGHLVRYGHPVLEQMETYLPVTRVIHIHGVKPDGTDHVDMSWFDAELFREILKKLGGDSRERVMTLEVFEDGYKKSLKAIKKMMGE